MTKPKQIGVTGGIGSGKSVACKVFEALGVPIYNADEQAKRLMNSSLVIKQGLLECFGADVYVQGEINRDFLADIVFKDKERLAQLNAIVHPVVRVDYEAWLLRQASPYVIKEAALMVESGLYKEMDELLVVIAPESLRIERIKERDSFRNEGEIKRIIAAQLNDEKFKSIASHVLYNDETELLTPQIIAIHNSLIG